MSDNGYGLLKGKKGIIFGALDERSLAWRVALACHREGGQFALSNAPVALRFGSLDELAEETGSTIIGCDVTNDYEIAELTDQLKQEYGKIDYVLHAIGMSPNIRKKVPYKELNYEWYQKTLDVSAISLHKILHAFDDADILNNGASVVALTYIGAQRIFSKYSDMNDAKALLESISRNFGSRLAEKGIRVNTVSQAPTKTSAGNGIKGFDAMYQFAELLAPLGNPSADDCADYCVSLFSDFTRMVTMQNLYHDGGFVTAGMSEKFINILRKHYTDEEDQEETGTITESKAEED